MRQTGAVDGLRARNGGGRVGGTVVAGCVAIALVTATLGLPANLTGIFAARLHLSGTQLTWVGDASFFGAAVSAYLLGSIAERFGRRRILLLSASLVVLGLVVAAFSNSAGVLESGQAISGIGVGGLAATSLSVVMHVTHTARQRALHLSAYASALTLGAVGSAVIGGYTAGGSSYRAAFLWMAGLAAVLLVVIALTCAESAGSGRDRIDLVGQVALIAGLAGILYGVIEGSALSWGDGGVVAAFVIGGIGAAAFLIVERRAGGMIDLALFSRPGFATSSAAALVVFFAFSGSVYVYAIRVTIGQGHSALFAAAGLVVVGVTSGLFGFVSHAVLPRRGGVRSLLCGGLLCFAAGDLWISRISVGHTGFSTLLGFLLLIGIGQGAAIAGFTAGAMNAVDKQAEAMASASQGVLRQLGAPLGIAVVGAVVFSRSRSSFAGRLPGLGLPHQVAALAGGVNSHAGVLGVLESGLGAKVPSAGHAAVASLAGGLDDGALVVGIVCLLLAVAAAFTVGRGDRRGRAGEPTPTAADPTPADLTPAGPTVLHPDPSPTQG